MKNGNKFLLIFSALIFLIFLTGYFLFIGNTFSYPVWIAFLTGGSLTTLNFYIGIFTFRIAAKSSETRFTAVFLGGMIIRMALMLAAVYWVLRFLQIKKDVFIFVIFVFYTLFLIAEIFYFYLLRGRTD